MRRCDARPPRDQRHALVSKRHRGHDVGLERTQCPLLSRLWRRGAIEPCRPGWSWFGHRCPVSVDPRNLGRGLGARLTKTLARNGDQGETCLVQTAPEVAKEAEVGAAIDDVAKALIAVVGYVKNDDIRLAGRGRNGHGALIHISLLRDAPGGQSEARSNQNDWRSHDAMLPTTEAQDNGSRFAG